MSRQKGDGWTRPSDILPNITELLIDIPGYEPPYESPLEDYFARHITKYFAPNVKFEKQVWVETVCGNYRIDFVATYNSRTIAFECDGSQHSEWYDLWRDAMILSSGDIDEIYRLPGRTIFECYEACFYMIARSGPSYLFTPRANAFLKEFFDGLNTDCSRNWQVFGNRIEREHLLMDFDSPLGEEVDVETVFDEVSAEYIEKPVFRRYYSALARRVSGLKTPYDHMKDRLAWPHLYKYAKKRGSRSLEDFIYEVREEEIFPDLIALEKKKR